MHWTGGTWCGAQPSGRIQGFAYDTRRLQAGQIFVAIQTDKRDGHDFLESAHAAGASAALVSRLIPEVSIPQLQVSHTIQALQDIGHAHRARFEGPVIGITGSCGKTSTKDLLFRLLGEAHTHATAGNLNNEIGVPLTLSELEPERHRYAVVEAGINQPHEMRRLTDCIEPDIGMVTLVGPAHLELLGSLEAIAEEKSQMLRGNRVGDRRYFPESCLNYAPFRALEQDSVVLRRSSPGKADPASIKSRDYIYAEDAQPGQPRMLVMRQGLGPTHFFELPLVSPGMVDNAALALAVALELGMPVDQIHTALQSWRPSRFRGELLRAGDQWFYADCYNANPASVVDALAAFEKTFPERMPRLYILGSMNELGPEAGSFHREMGSRIHLRPTDYVFFIGEYADSMLAGLKANHPPPGSYQVFEKTESARLSLAQFSGAVLLKGSRSYALETLLPDEAEPAEVPASLYPNPC